MATRRESVVVTLVDEFSRPGAVIAARARQMATEVNGIEGRVRPLGPAFDKAGASARSAGRDFDVFSTSVRRSGPEIDRLSGRLALLVRGIAAIGPAASPVGAGAAAAIGGLSSALAFAVTGIGTAVIAFQGFGDALEAVNEAALDPTVENVEKANEALRGISPTARQFAIDLAELAPQFEKLQAAASEPLFTGMRESIDDIVVLMPTFRRMLGGIGEVLGETVADGAESLSSERWRPFFKFIETEAPAALATLSSASGNLAHGLAELWMSFDPLNDGVLDWLDRAAASFDDWATGLSGTQGFQDFVAYVQETGPQVLDTFTALANMVLQIGEAAAPLGGPVLAAVEALADAVSAIADSEIGTPLLTLVSAMSALSLATRGFQAVAATTFISGKLTTPIRDMAGALLDVDRNQRRATSSVAAFAAAERKRADAIKGGLSAMGKSAALIGGIAVASSGAADGLGLSNTALLGMAGIMGGPWGVAAGVSAGLLLDLRANAQAADDAWRGFNEALRSRDLVAAQANLEALNAGFAKSAGLAAGIRAGTAATGTGIVGSAIASRFADDDVERNASRVAAATAAQTVLEAKLNAERERSVAKADALARATGGLAGQSRDLGGDLEATADGYLQAEASLDAYREEVGKTAQSFLDISSAASDSKLSLTDFIKQMEKNARALANFGDNAEKAARRGLDEGLIESLRQLGPEGAMRMRQLANATDEEIERASKAWRQGQAEAKRYTDDVVTAATAVRQLPKSWQTRLEVAADKAIASARAVKAELASIDRSIDVYVNVRRPNNGGLGPQLRAGGGYITGPGTATSDSIPAYLSNGEYVIRAAAVQKYGMHMFDRLNAMHFASGGSVSTTKSDDKMTPSEREDAAEKAKKERERLRRMLRDFEVDITDGARDVRRELRDFARSYRDAGGKWTKALDQQAQVILTAARQYEQQEQRLTASAEASRAAADAQRDLAEQAQQAAETIRGSWVQLSEQVAGNFTSSLTGKGLVGLDSALRSDIGGGTAMAQALQGLIADGLDGGLLRELASSDDYTTAQQLLALGPAGIQRYEDMYSQREGINAGRGWLVADREYGAEMRYADAVAAAETARADQAEAHAARFEARLQSIENAIVKQETLTRKEVSGAFPAAAGAFAAELRGAAVNGQRGKSNKPGRDR